MRTRPPLAVLLALAAVAAAPSASAQLPADVTLQLDAPSSLVGPGTGTVTMTATVTASCVKVLQLAPASPQGVPAVFEWQAEEGLIVVGPDRVVFDSAGCVGVTTLTAQQAFTIGVPRAVPGLRPMAIHGTVHLGDSSAEASASVTAEWISVNQLRLDQKLVQCKECGALPFQLTLSNFGNARTHYEFEVGTQPATGWTLTLPGPVTLDAGASQTVTATAGGHGGEGAFQVVVRPSSADDPSKTGEPLQATFLVRDISTGSKASPFPGAAPLLAGLALLAAALSRRRA